MKNVPENGNNSYLIINHTFTLDTIISFKLKNPTILTKNIYFTITVNVALHMAEEGNMSLYSITSVNILQIKPHHRRCKISIVKVKPYYKSSCL